MIFSFERWLKANHNMSKEELDTLPDSFRLKVYKHWTTFEDNVRLHYKNARHDGNHDEHK